MSQTHCADFGPPSGQLPPPSSHVWDWNPPPSTTTPPSCHLWVFEKGQPSPAEGTSYTSVLSVSLACSSGPSPDTSWGLPSPDPSPALPAVHRAMVKPVLVLLPVLGLTWLVGLLVHLSPAWAYAAVGLNSFQVPPGPGPLGTGAPTCTGTQSGWLVCRRAGDCPIMGGGTNGDQGHRQQEGGQGRGREQNLESKSSASVRAL